MEVIAVTRNLRKRIERPEESALRLKIYTTAEPRILAARGGRRRSVFNPKHLKNFAQPNTLLTFVSC